MQQRWWSVGPVHKDASSKCWAQCLERINRHISLSLLFFFFFLHKKEFVSKQLWVLCVIASVQPAALCCGMCRGRSLVVPLCLSPLCSRAACSGRACLTTCAVPSVCCHAVPGDPMAVPLYLPPSCLSWGQWGGAESVWWRRGRQSRVSSLRHKVSMAVAPRWDSLAFLCQDGESQLWRLQSDMAPWLPKLVWWAQDRQHSKCFISIMSCIVRQ